MARLVVVGSINQDRIVRCAELPSAGETVVALSAASGFGGKGGNQACAAARLGAEVVLVAAVGADAAGQEAIADLRRHGVDVARVQVVDSAATGRADVFVDDRGENFIVLEPGANQALDAAAVADALAALRLTAADVVLTSNEIDVEAVAAAADAASGAGAAHVHNLAPYRPLGPWGHGAHLVLVANDGEARRATGTSDPARAAAELATGRRAAVVTLGAAGALLAVGEELHSVPAPSVTAVDTTGAGDAFCGALAAALAAALVGDTDEHAAVARAVRAGAFAVGGLGARGALATVADLA